jgi:hypothetical protein
MKAQAVTEVPVQLHWPDFVYEKTGQKNPQFSRFMHEVSCTPPGTEVAMGDGQNIQRALNDKNMQKFDHKTEETVDKKAKKGELH